MADFDEALGMLGLSLSADDASVRRAYLRAVKAHPPERDPIGFQKVREAYELVRDQIGWRRHAADFSDEPDEPEDDDPPLDELEAPESLEPIATTDPDAAERTQIRELRGQLEAATDPEVAVSMARDAVSRMPDSPEARWALIETLDTAEQDEQAAQELLAAHRAKLSGFTLALLYRAPELLSVDELRAIAESEAPDAQQAAAQALSSRGHALDAARIELKLLSEGDDDSKNLGPTIELVLKLIAENSLVAAHDLAQAIRGFLESSGTRLESELGARWLLVSELLAIETAAPPAALRVMAEVCAGGSMLKARGVLGRLRATEPDQLRLLKQALAEHAPNLNAMFGELIDPPVRAAGVPLRELPWGLVAGVVMVALQLFRWCASDASGTPTKPPIEQRERR